MKNLNKINKNTMAPVVMEFSLTQEEVERARAFHTKCRKKYAGAIGGAFTYSFTPTSIGVIVSVECGVCKEKLVLTDFNDW